VPATSERCSARSLALDEPLLGTASVVRNWLLIEHPGPWGPNALLDSPLPAGLGTELERLSRGLGIRVLLIRRHGRHAPRGARVIACHSGPDAAWMERADLEDAREVLDLDVEALGASLPMGLERRDGEAAFLVCTHGRHDVCCAERGRALAGAVSAAYPDAAWECSHIGGDRFAGNLVCLPHGIYYGRVEPQEAPGIAEEYRRGRVDLERFRGRSCFPFWVQAAEAFLRTDRGLSGVDDLLLASARRTAVDQGEVRFVERSGVGYVVEVATGRAARARRLTCHSEREERPPTFRVLRIASDQGKP
jgi:hypothetical protein